MFPYKHLRAAAKREMHNAKAAEEQGVPEVTTPDVKATQIREALEGALSIMIQNGTPDSVLEAVNALLLTAKKDEYAARKHAGDEKQHNQPCSEALKAC